MITYDEFLLGGSNLLFLIGTLFLLKDVIENRNSIKDFNPTGSAINTIGMTFSGLYLAHVTSYLALALLIPTLIFWFLAFVYGFKYRYLNKKKK